MNHIEINNIHKMILQLLKPDKDMIDTYLSRIKQLKNVKKTDVSVQRKTDLLIHQLETYVKNTNENLMYNYYLIEALPLVNQYNKEITKPQVINFMDDTEIDSKAVNKIVKKYLQVAKRYKPDLEIIENISENKKYMVCKNCNGTVFINNMDEEYICYHCGNLYELLNHDKTTYKDLGRINITTKYSYDRKNHFRNCINQFQAKQTSVIPCELYKDLDTYLQTNQLLVKGFDNINHIKYKNVSKNDIYMYLKEHKQSKYYDDITLIYYTLTGNKPPDLSNLEAKLIHDFEDLINLYDKMVRTNQIKLYNRKNFINTQYVLYQLLKKYKYPCNISDFNILKTSDRKSFHDEICKQLFDKLGWNFTAIL
jgi:DNA-directed RNA polymerase subunit RPC12/RpoP